MRKPKVGDSVWLRDDLVVGVEYGTLTFIEIMNKGILVTVSHIEYDDFKTKECLFWYNFEMIDWEKTDKINNGIVMPEYFDDWVKDTESHAFEDLILSLAFELLSDKCETGLSHDMYDFFFENEEKVYRALLDGYTVEGEVE